MNSKRLTLGQQLYLACYWFSTNFHWGALLTILIPVEVLRFVDDAEKGAGLGIVLALGAVIAMVTQPLAGAFSDRSTHRSGRRRPFMVVGVLLNSGALLTMAYTQHFSVFIAAFLAVQLGNNLAGAAYQGLIPDLVPASQRGEASGYMGLMTMLGTISGNLLAGALVAQGLIKPFYWVITAVLIVGLTVTLLKVKEEQQTEAQPLDLKGLWLNPKQYPDFAWLFLSRALVMLGFYTLLNFMTYYLKDVFARPNYTEDSSYVSAMVMVGATLSTFIAGRLSDRLGRRHLVLASSLAMGVTALAFVFTRNFGVALGFGVLFGLGYGALISVEWALAIDVLPSQENAARYLGLWGIAVTLPQVIAPALGGQLIDLHQGAALGYQYLYGLAFVYFTVGAFAVLKVREGRRDA